MGNTQWDKNFDPKKEVDEILRIQKLQKKKRRQTNKIEEFRGELGQLYKAGASFAGLTIWLLRRKKIAVSRSAVHRVMSRWPEVQIRRRYA